VAGSEYVVVKARETSCGTKRGLVVGRHVGGSAHSKMDGRGLDTDGCPLLVCPDVQVPWNAKGNDEWW
jgi:hypothetical protein